MRELERGLDASLSERTIISGEGVNRPLSWSLRNRREEKKQQAEPQDRDMGSKCGSGTSPGSPADATGAWHHSPRPAEAPGQEHPLLTGGKRLL